MGLKGNQPKLHDVNFAGGAAKHLSLCPCGVLLWVSVGAVVGVAGGRAAGGRAGGGCGVVVGVVVMGRCRCRCRRCFA